MNPNFESPAHTARDLLERNITVYHTPHAHMWKQWLSGSSNPDYKKLGETMLITKFAGQFNAMTRNELLSQGIVAQMISHMSVAEIQMSQDQTVNDDYQGKYKWNFGRGYYRGEKVDGMIPGGGHLTKKKWHLNEVDIQHSH